MLIIDWSDFKKCAHTQQAAAIKGQVVSRLESDKHLGTIIDSKLNFEANKL